MELQGLKVCFLGDSITNGDGTSNSSKRFSSRLAEKYGVETYNYGICGTRIARQKVPSENPEFDQYFESRIDSMQAEADVVMVFGGTNDFGHGDAPIGKMEDRSIDTFYGALHVTYSKLIEKYPNAVVVVITPTHRLDENNLNGDGCKKENAGNLKYYVDIIREVAEYYSLRVLDLYASSGLQPAVPIIREKYMPDGLHPNDDGHVILTEIIAAYLKQL